MKLRRVISLLLLTVYLFATGGMAYASLSCHCITPTERAHHLCCNHCQQHDEATAGKETLTAPCCSDHHSTEIDLYTGTSAENGKSIKSISTDLPAALAAEFSCVADPLPVTCDKVAEQRPPHFRQAPLLPSGLRAPPVLA